MRIPQIYPKEMLRKCRPFLSIASTSLQQILIKLGFHAAAIAWVGVKLLQSLIVEKV